MSTIFSAGAGSVKDGMANLFKPAEVVSPKKYPLERESSLWKT
jgi:hypothetical protein